MGGAGREVRVITSRITVLITGAKGRDRALLGSGGRRPGRHEQEKQKGAWGTPQQGFQPPA